MIRSSFASFTTARLAIQASQNALAIVGQNMANVKTPGYTRQRLDQISLNSQGLTNIYQANPDAHIGYGVMVTGVSQIRDPFLDARYRTEMGSLGAIDKKVDVLSKIGEILDETDKKAMQAQFADLEKQLKTLANPSITDSNDSLVRSSAQTLVGLFNQYSKQLSEVKGDLVTNTESDVTSMNNLLKEIKELNVTIKNSQVHGNAALELQDQRNYLIDQLSTYVDVRVSHTYDTTMTGNKVDVIRIDMACDSSTGSSVVNLIDDVKDPAEFSMRLDPDDGTYSINVKDTYKGMNLDIKSDKGTLSSSISMLNDNGEFSDPATMNRGVGYYQKSLDNMAKTLAEVFNKLNAPTVDNDGETIGGDLFSTSDGSTDITAANITIAKGWLDGSYKIIPSRGENPPAGDTPSSENSNILNMMKALTDKQAFKKDDGTTVFNGSFYDCFTNIVNTQATDLKSADSVLDNYLSITTEIANSRDSVSGVNLDEEGMDLIQYNTSLTAASKLMTALDEALNTIINMGLVGR